MQFAGAKSVIRGSWHSLFIDPLHLKITHFHKSTLYFFSYLFLIHFYILNSNPVINCTYFLQIFFKKKHITDYVQILLISGCRQKPNKKQLCPVDYYPLIYRYKQTFSKYIKLHPALCMSGSDFVEMPLKQSPGPFKTCTKCLWYAKFPFIFYKCSTYKKTPLAHIMFKSKVFILITYLNKQTYFLPVSF